MPKQSAYKQKNMNHAVDSLQKASQKLDELAKKDFKYQIPKMEPQVTS